MKHALTFLGLIISAVIFFAGSLLFQKPHQISQSQKKVLSISLSPQPSQQVLSQILFVPYWTLSPTKIDRKDYATVIYFGLTANSQGINKDEPGYKNLSLFDNAMHSFSGNKLLAITLTDTSFNNILLQNPKLQETIATQAASIVKENGFSGLVLDFEMNALSFDSVVKGITSNANMFAKSARQNGLEFYVTAFGDTFYRLRPYDIAALGSLSDGVIVMAYDFHKANGDPGPNFPYQGDEYNFQKMTSDFTKVVPKEKLNILFGMFGYDWTVDAQGRSTGPAQTLTTQEIEQKFVNKIITDPNSLEKHIIYTDTFGKNHIVWFEDSQSAQKKIDFLKTQGISSVGYWAYTYY